LACFSVGPALAQKAPDAGSILRDFRGTTPAPPAPVLPPAQPTPPAPVPEEGGGHVLVKGFHVVATQFPEATLQALLKDYVGRELTLSDLREAAFRISEYYRQHDLLARAIVPRQTIRDGIVEIDVLEGKLGAVTVDPTSQTRLDPEVATGLVTGRAASGELLHPSQLQEGVAVLNEVPGVKATATIRPGAEPAQTDADLKIEDTPLVVGSLQADNEGANFIGARRAIGNLAINDPFGRGEQLSALALKSSGSTYGRAAAQMPVGTSGLALGVNTSYLDYKLEGPFRALDQRGYAYTFGATAAYPIERSPTVALSAIAAFDHKQLVDRALGTDIDNRLVDAGDVGLLATLFDTWLGGGVNNFGVRATMGNLDRSNNGTDLAIDAQTAKTNGHYGKLNANANRVQRLAETTDLFVSFSGQLAINNLDSSEKFSLGGPYGVRAYPVNEANGDEGFLTTVELRQRFPHGIGVFGFYDLGGIVINHSPWAGWQPVAGEPNDDILQGAGIGASWTPVTFAQVKATYAHTIGSNPGHDANGNNADGRNARHQLWLEGVIVF
jgi:hemolysin activation/secretion protein